MIIRLLNTGYSYNLAIDDDFRRLKVNIGNMQRRGKWDVLADIYRQVTQLAPPAADQRVLNRIKEIAQKSMTALPDKVQPPVHKSDASIVASASMAASSSSSAYQASTSTQTPIYIPVSTRRTVYIISMAPLNSSGDIYHILAYLMLLQAKQVMMPMVQLNYDVEPGVSPNHSSLTVGDQVNRSIHFAATLGMAGYFHCEKLQYNNTGRENVRQKQLEAHFTGRSFVENICYLDQMATTTMISHAVLESGFEPVTRILQQGFAKRDLQGFPAHAQQAVDSYVSTAMQKINSCRKSAGQELLVLHVRHSSTANNNLNFPDSFINQLAIYLNDKGYQVCFVLADDRKRKAHYLENGAPELTNSIVVLEPFKEKSFLINTVDYSKQAHLQLLQSLKQYKQTRGVIGNTSGTLDIAAMIGLATYCIHQFTDTRLSYQECRLYFQLAFMSLGALTQQDNIYQDNGLHLWLDKPAPRKGIGLFDGSRSVGDRVAEKKQTHGYSKLFFSTTFSNGAIQQIELPEADAAIKRLQGSGA